MPLQELRLLLEVVNKSHQPNTVLRICFHSFRGETKSPTSECEARSMGRSSEATYHGEKLYVGVWAEIQLFQLIMVIVIIVGRKLFATRPRRSS